MDIQKIPEISLAITGVQFSSRRTVFEGTNLSIKPCANPPSLFLHPVSRQFHRGWIRDY